MKSFDNAARQLYHLVVNNHGIRPDFEEKVVSLLAEMVLAHRKEIKETK